MTLRKQVILAIIALGASIVLSGCGNKQAKTKPTAAPAKPPAANTSEPIESAKKPGTQPPAQTPSNAGQNLPLSDALNPLGSSNSANPLTSPAQPKSSDQSSPMPTLSTNKPAPVKPLAPNVRPEPKQLLVVVQNVYRSMRSVNVEGMASQTVKQDGKVVMNEPAAKFTTKFLQPNRFIIINPGTKITCDGKTVYAYSNIAKRFDKMPFSKEFAQQMVRAKPGVGLMGLLMGMDYSQAVQSYKLLDDAKVSGQDTYVLELKFKNGIGSIPGSSIVETLWIGKKDLGIYKNRVVARIRPIAPRGFKGKVPMLVETTITGIQTKFEPNAKLSEAAFVFKAPSGAKQLEKPKAINLIKKPAPDFTYTAADGSKKKLSDSKGKPVILIFWAAQMPTQELKAMQSAYESQKDNVDFIAINLNTEVDKVKDFLKQQSCTFPTSFADEAIAKVAIQSYGLRGVPSMLIIDKSGAVRLATIGVPKADDLKAKLEKYGN